MPLSPSDAGVVVGIRWRSKALVAHKTAGRDEEQTGRSSPFSLSVAVLLVSTSTLCVNPKRWVLTNPTTVYCCIDHTKNDPNQQSFEYESTPNSHPTVSRKYTSVSSSGAVPQEACWTGLAQNPLAWSNATSDPI